MFFGMLATTIYVFRSLVGATKSLVKAVGATPVATFQQLGFAIEHRDVAGGRASAMWGGVPVRVAWQMSAQYSGEHINPNTYRTWVSAQIAPPLGIGLQVQEEAGGPPLGDARLDGQLVLRANDLHAARSRVLNAAAPLSAALGSGGQLSVTDDTVAVVVADIVDQEHVLRARLDAVSHAARLLSARG